MPEHRLTLAEVVMDDKNGLEDVLDYLQNVAIQQDALNNNSLNTIPWQTLLFEFKQMIGRTVENAEMDSTYRAKLISWATNPDEDK